jgi:hypothetical protein
MHDETLPREASFTSPKAEASHPHSKSTSAESPFMTALSILPFRGLKHGFLNAEDMKSV